jgi:hypothetical protein
MRYIHFQIQDGWSWRTVGSAEEGTLDSAILIEMRNVKMRFPDRRIRCVNDDGRILDMMD